MANRALQQKTLKMKRQYQARPYVLNDRAMTPDHIEHRDVETGKVLTRNEVRLSMLNTQQGKVCNTQRQLATFRDREFIRVERTSFPILRDGVWIV